MVIFLGIAVVIMPVDSACGGPGDIPCPGHTAYPGPGAYPGSSQAVEALQPEQYLPYVESYGDSNLIVNGGLEDWFSVTDLVEWVESGAVNQDSDAHSGMYAVKLTYTGRQASIYQAVRGLSGSNVYTLSGYCKSQNGQECRYSIYDVSNSGLIVAEAKFGTTGQWERFEYIFTTAPNTTHIIVEFLGGHSNGAVLFDDLSLVLSTPPTPTPPPPPPSPTP
jgi:hypothetical protein